jgi:magnesium-transporting ATPase (P-type)
LRGSSLRNTEWVLGIVVYAGHQTKIMMNSTSAKFKMSKLEKLTNRQIILIFCFQIIVCFIAAIFAAFYQQEIKVADYLALKDSTDPWVTNVALLIIQ